MKYVNLGRSGLKVSRLCLGCMSYGEPERLPQPWSLDEKASRPLIRQARGATHPIPGFFPARPFCSLLTIA